MGFLKKAALFFPAVIFILCSGFVIYLYLSERAGLPSYSGKKTISYLREKVTVDFDSHAVPHIAAKNTRDLFFVFGYLQARERLFQMDFMRRLARGELSEVLGPIALEQDKMMRTLRIKTLSDENAKNKQALSKESREIVDGFIVGINAYIRENRKNPPLEFKLLFYKPRPWTASDSLSISYFMAWMLASNWDSEVIRMRFRRKLDEKKAAELLPVHDPVSPFIFSQEPSDVFQLELDQVTPKDPEKNREPALHKVEAGGETGKFFFPPAPFASRLMPFPSHAASNSWVVSGVKTKSGKPILANDPHLTFMLPSIWYEAHITDGELNAAGVFIPGLPLPAIGATPRIAWGLTTTMADVSDVYVEKLNPEKTKYLFGKTWMPLKMEEERIRVRGKTKSYLLKVYLTHHGPLINESFDIARKVKAPLALRWTGHYDNPARQLETVRRMCLAENSEEFLLALAGWRNPVQNVVFADSGGNIGYMPAGLYPARMPAKTGQTGASGDSMEPVPGWKGKHEWMGFVPAHQIPQRVNPEAGFIVTANNTVAENPPIFISRQYAAPYRAMRIEERLKQKEKLNLEDMQNLQMDTTMKDARHILPGLLPILKKGTTGMTTEQLKALSLLETWNFKARRQSAGAAVFHVFYYKLAEKVFKDELGEELFHTYRDMDSYWMYTLNKMVEKGESSFFDNVNTAKKEKLMDVTLDAFKEGISFLVENAGASPERWEWGRVHRITFPHPLGQFPPLSWVLNVGSFPAPGSSNTVNKSGIFLQDGASILHRLLLQGLFKTAYGPSMRMIVDFSNPDEPLFVNTLGQSGHWLSPYRTDQTGDYLQGRYHPVPLSMDKIKKISRSQMEFLPAAQ